ncbi:MAG TPA: hypothetical protein PKK06_00530 [Phycisphaerae bacterium]|nr:hypothetical protein [Phycisphaerae bacterium]HNU43906.1 hypothetical protein [Phycisphaerae bacterium]
MIRKSVSVGLALVAVAALAFVLSGAYAQDKPGTMAPPGAKEVTLNGKIVDLQCYMTGHFASEDHAKCTADCIRGGVPAGLETKDGLIVLGQGMKGAAGAVLAHAFNNVKVTGKLYEKGGVRYLDITAVEAATPAPEKPAAPAAPPAKPAPEKKP